MLTIFSASVVSQNTAGTVWACVGTDMDHNKAKYGIQLYNKTNYQRSALSGWVCRVVPLADLRLLNKRKLVDMCKQ